MDVLPCTGSGHLHTSLRQVNTVGQVLPGKDVRVVGLVKHLLQFPELVAGESRSVAPFLLGNVADGSCSGQERGGREGEGGIDNAPSFSSK